MALLVALGIAAAPNDASAQRKWTRGVIDLYIFQSDAPAKLVAAAFARPYGQALNAEFAAILSDSADSECVKTRHLTRAHVRERALAMLPERGVYMLERFNAMNEPPKFKEFLRARIGREGIAEIERLRKEPIVKAFIAVDEPARLAEIAGHVAEHVSRYALIMRIKFVRPISPLEADIPALGKLDPTDLTDVVLQRMIADDKSGTLDRYLELMGMAQQPYRDSLNMDLARKYGPGELLARRGRDREEFHAALAGLCVAKPK